MPALGFRGIFKMTFLRHITALSGVGFGGGSLVYANTLPIPKESFFSSPSWSGLAPWREELAPHYETGLRMLGATENPHTTDPDRVLKAVAADIGREDHFEATRVAVYFGEAGVTTPDPYFGGEGPDRTGCIQCGACMIGCRHNAKNTLDKNYLHLAEKRGLIVHTDTEVRAVHPREQGGYTVDVSIGARVFGRARRTFTAKNVVFCGGVLGTVPLLLALKGQPDGLPNISDALGSFVRTNSEVLMGIVSQKPELKMSKGVAITSILHTDEHSHIEPVRYPDGSGAFRFLSMPHAPGDNLARRLFNAARYVLQHPVRTLRATFVWDWARHTLILLYMRTVDGHLTLRLGRSFRTGFARGLVTNLADGPAPTASIPEATELAHRVASKIDGTVQSLITETLMGIPTTAHILGGCCMGQGPDSGVIDHQHRVFGYECLYVVDGSAVSANPGVNPSLTITALAERAMSFIEPAPTGT
jgi:cholesterol oxidase